MAIWTHPWFILLYLGITFLIISIYIFVTTTKTDNILSYLDLLFLSAAIILFILSLFYLFIYGTNEINV